MFVYWFFDNLQILSALKIISRDPEFLGKAAMTAWFFSLVLDLFRLIRDLTKTNDQINFYIDFGKKNPEKKEGFVDDLKKLRAQKRTILLNLLKTCGDILPSSKGSGLIDKAGITGINDLTCGIGGCISAAIFVYQTYK